MLRMLFPARCAGLIRRRSATGKLPFGNVTHYKRRGTALIAGDEVTSLTFFARNRLETPYVVSYVL